MSDLRFDDYLVSVSRRQLRRGDELIPLPGKAFDLLAYLAANPGRVLLKNELMNAVWPDSCVEESNLTQNISLLRRALGAGNESPIATLPGRGYQFTAYVSGVPQPGPETAGVSLVAAASVSGVVEATHSRLLYEEETEDRIVIWRSPLAMSLVVAAVIAMAAAGWLAWQRWEDRVGGPPVEVVLADMDGSTGDPVLDRSLVDAMRFDLAQSPFVTVLPVATVRQTLAQMMHKPDDALTPALTRDLCERTGSQAVLHGSVVRVGSQFLLNEEATNCVDGSTMAIAKQESRTREELPHAVDKLAETLRHGLGESRRMIARFDAPLFAVNTGSIEALEDFSQANLLSQRGKMPEAIGLLKQAVELDPKFAAAYLALANLYANLGDKASERTFILEAYNLRDTASAPTRLYTVARYHTAITGDLFESLRNYENWIALYPRNLAAWVGLLEVNRLLGRHTEAIDAANHAIAINPHYLSIYYGLALEQTHAGNLTGARSTCELAITRGLDGDVIRMNLLRIAYLQHDTKLFEEQTAWAATHPDSSHVLLNEALIALAEGKLGDAHGLVDRMADSLQHQGLTPLANTYRQTLAKTYAELGEVDEGRQSLQAAPIDPEEPDELIALAETGDPSGATAMLHDELAKHTAATLWTNVYGPEIRAVVALRTHDPRKAISELESSRAFDGTSLDMTILRAQAYFDAGQWTDAESEYTRALTHPEIDPVSDAAPIAQLGLARSLAAGGREDEAREAYKIFLNAWSHADADNRLLATVRKEFASLPQQ